MKTAAMASCDGAGGACVEGHDAALPRRALAVALAVGLFTACGGDKPTTPTAPTATAPTAPVGLVVRSQSARLAGNEVTLNWAAQPGLSYEVSVGSSPGSSDVLVTGVATPGSYTWTGVRPGTFHVRVSAKNSIGTSPPSAELRILSVDLRDVIDALLFNLGPLADFPPLPVPAGLFPWPDGQNVRVLMSEELTASTRQAAQAFVDQYKALSGDAVSGFVESTSDPMKDFFLTNTLADLAKVSFSRLPLGTVAVRVLSSAAGGCSIIAAGCGAGGAPNPYRGFVGRGIVTVISPNASGVLIGHELGHTWALHHVNMPAGSMLPRPLMAGSMDRSTVAATPGPLSETEAEAIRIVRSAGLRNGSLRDAAVAAGLVNR